MTAQMYVDGIGFTDVAVLNGVEELPGNAVFFTFDEEWMFYITGDSDTVFAVAG